MENFFKNISPFLYGTTKNNVDNEYFTCVNPLPKLDIHILRLLTDQEHKNNKKKVPVIGTDTYKHFLEMMIKFVKQQKSSLYISQILGIFNSTPKTILGDNQVLETKNDVEEKNKNKKGKKKKKNKLGGKKALAIIAKNKASKLESLFQDFIRTLSIRNKDVLLKPLPDEPVEFRLLRLLIASQFIESNEWIMLSLKTIKDSYNYDGVSLLAIFHIKEMVKFVIHTCRFSFKKLDEKSPHLIVNNKSMLDSLDNIKLRDFQKQLKSIKFFKQNVLMPKLVFLQAMIGSGKTIAAISIFKKIADQCNEDYALSQKKKEENIYPQILYICPVQKVREQMITLCNNTNIGFSVADWDIKKNKPKIHTSPLCKKESGKRGKKKITLVVPVMICDPPAALYLLLKILKKKLDKTVIFFDEPTVDADQKDSAGTLLTSSILYESSPCLILSSATLPRPDEISPVIEHFKSKYPDGDIVSISAMKSQIGCQLVTFDGTLIAPHTTCKTKEDVNSLITRLNTEPFIGRLYSPRMVFRLGEDMKSNVNDVFDVDKYFLDNPTSLSHNSFVECVIKLLQRLLEEDDEVIEKVCSNATLQNNQEEELSIGKILREQIGLFKDKPTLIASNNPIMVAKKILEGLINNTTYLEKKLNSAIKEYQSNLTSRQKNLDKIEKITSRDQRAILQQNIMNENIIPDISFLNGIIPYSKEWAETFDLQHDSKKSLTYGCDFTEIVDELGVQNWLLLLLFAGVGVCGNLPELTSSYSRLVSKLASNGRLRYIISDDSIIYGTSWPIGNVVCLDIADKHSIASLMQLYGRAGRVGKCYTAFAYASNRVHKRIIDFIMGKESSGAQLEAQNICLAFQKYKKMKC